MSGWLKIGLQFIWIMGGTCLCTVEGKFLCTFLRQVLGEEHETVSLGDPLGVSVAIVTWFFGMYVISELPTEKGDLKK